VASGLQSAAEGSCPAAGGGEGSALSYRVADYLRVFGRQVPGESAEQDEDL